MADHTPGPWRWEGGFRTLRGANKHIVCMGKPFLNNEADGPLLEAAPELLAALEGCRGYFEWMAAQQTEHLTSGAAYAPDAAWLQPIRAAIAKAKGI